MYVHAGILLKLAMYRARLLFVGAPAADYFPSTKLLFSFSSESFSLLLKFHLKNTTVRCTF